MKCISKQPKTKILKTCTSKTKINSVASLTEKKFGAKFCKKKLRQVSKKLLDELDDDESINNKSDLAFCLV